MRAHEIDAWVKSGAYEKILSGEFIRRANGSIAEGPHPLAGAEGEGGAAAAAELAIVAALSRAYGVHVAPRIPEHALHLALGAFAEPFVQDERAVALYDDTFSGTGDKGVLLSDRRVFSHSRPKKGVSYASLPAVEDLPGGLLSRPGLRVGELELRFHTRDVRDSFRAAIAAAVAVHRKAP
ncbi:hypothetical protein HY251_06205 [bacterium]|nr:hypothetical protein [bacterium]